MNFNVKERCKEAYWLLRAAGYSNWSDSTKSQILETGHVLSTLDKKILSGYDNENKTLSFDEFLRWITKNTEDLKVGNYLVYFSKGSIEVGCQKISNKIVREIYKKLGG